MIRRKEKEDALTPQIPPKEITFIADAMLGRLARWLRFIGYDTLYYPGITDNDLIKLAREQERIILTRDTRLIQRKGIKAFALIQADDALHQISEVITLFRLKQFAPLSRCVSCNGMLSEIPDKATIKDSVPEFVFLKSKNFLKCNSCGKIYWEGSHPKKFQERIKEVIKINP
jgi:uncharacterized protein with PIN domain